MATSAKGGPPGGDGNEDSLIALSTRLGFICRMIIHIYMVASRDAEERRIHEEWPPRVQREFGVAGGELAFF